MKKIVKVFLLLTLTSLVALSAFVVIRVVSSRYEQDGAAISAPISGSAEVSYGQPQRAGISQMDYVMELEAMDRLAERSKDPALQAPPPGTSESAFDNGAIPFNNVPLDAFAENRKDKRLLDGNMLSQPGIIAFNQQAAATNQEYYAYKYIFTNLKEYSTRFVLYPYSFVYSFSYNPTVYDKGAIFTMKPSLLPTDDSVYNYFKSFNASTDVNFGKAKALYDINIGVLSIQDYYQDIFTEITYDSGTFCNIMATYMGKYRDCMRGSSYFAFRNDSKNAGLTAFAYLDQDDIVVRNLLLTPDGAPRFQVFIIPDYFTGAESIITKKLKQEGINRIKEFVNKGGLIYAVGKGGYLVELFGIVKSGMYNSEMMMTSTEGNLNEQIVGCDNNPTTDFTKAILCMNVNPTSNSFILSAYMINKAKATDFTVLMSYNAASTTLKKKTVAGTTMDLTDQDKTYLPFTLFGTYGQGRIILVNGNPLFRSGYYKIFYNALLYAMSKNVVFDAYVGTEDNAPLPGLEAGVLLNAKFSFINLFDKPVNNLAIHFWLPNGVALAKAYDYCVPDTGDAPFTINLAGVNKTSHTICRVASIAGFAKFDSVLQIEIQDPLVTKARYDILMVAGGVEYTDSDSGATTKYDFGGLRASASMSALLVPTLNTDPTWFFPIQGRGQYIDSILSVANKEDTRAINVTYFATIPMIAPIIDKGDETIFIRKLKFLPSYYRNNSIEYRFPFKKEPGVVNKDIIDYKWLNKKDVTLVTDKDTPVKHKKQIRDASKCKPADKTGKYDIGNMNKSKTVDNKETVVEETHDDDDDRFSESTTHRHTVFVDHCGVGGAKVLYPNGIPTIFVNPNNPSVARRDIIWLRSDFNFYNGAAYQLPFNMLYNYVVSLDRYPLKYTGTCYAKFKTAPATIMVAGYFDLDHEDGHKAHEYCNEIFMHCGLQRLEYSDIAAFTSGSIKNTSFLLPIADPNVTNAGDIMDFTARLDGTGYLTDYPEVRFTYAHKAIVFIDGALSRQGGKLEIILSSNLFFIGDHIMNGYITYAADLVAFYKTTYDRITNTITCYFKRGLKYTDVSGKGAIISVVLEGLNTRNNFDALIRIYQMRYDISSVATRFESYEVKSFTGFTFAIGCFFKLPSIEIKVVLNRPANRGLENSMMGYESLAPFSRYGVYVQELGHRTIWPPGESHHNIEPGIQAHGNAFGLFHHFGIPEIPYLQSGSSGAVRMMPSTVLTSRLEWYDIWGRHWAQPVRVGIPYVYPKMIDAGTGGWSFVKRDFLVITTYEMYKCNGMQRLLTWKSDEIVDILFHIRLINLYPKYFDITTCSHNRIPVFQEDEDMFGKNRVFDSPPYAWGIADKDAPSDSYHINMGHRAHYGSCMTGDITVKGKKPTKEEKDKTTSSATSCAPKAEPSVFSMCTTEMNGITTIISKTDATIVDDWNYLPDVDNSHPKGYIKREMWDMTDCDYDDSPLDKSYKYHMDNNLPGIDFGPEANPARWLPHNVLAFPIYKGFGYDMAYVKTKGVGKYAGFKGWWSDNLQNRDWTLMAGQEYINDIADGKPSLLPDSAWIHAKKLISPKGAGVIYKRLSNIYTCMFNQHRIKMTPGQQRDAYPANIYQNNIIPIIPDLIRNDPRLTAFDCSNFYQYSPYNISMFDNLVTSPIRDWLYFAANLRGNAHENIKIVLSLGPYGSTKLEGLVKIHEGARFTYWNPATIKGWVTTTEGPMFVIDAARCDITIDCEVMPQVTTTFKSVLYHLLTIKDPAEILREWTYDLYLNSYGFGDVTTSVEVGGMGMTSIIEPGQFTYAKVVFLNNAGYDWNLKKRGANFVCECYNSLNDDDLIITKVKGLQKPLAFNFLNMEIPVELQPYLTIIPSDQFVAYTGKAFGTINANPAKIKNGARADYYYKIRLNGTIPDNLRGRVHEIKVSMNYLHFDKLPGYNDPTPGNHDYTLLIPSIKIGIPYNKSSSQYAGKVFYTSGYSTDLTIAASVPKYWQIQGVKVITDEQLSNLRIAAGDPDNYNTLMAGVWETINSPVTVPYAFDTRGNPNVDGVLILKLFSAYPKFPIPNAPGLPDTASIKLLVKVYTCQLPQGTVRVITKPTIYFTDFGNVVKSDYIPQPIDKTVLVRGAWMKVCYYATIMTKKTDGSFDTAKDQRFFASDPSGYVRIIISTVNIGTATGYNVNFTAIISTGVTLLEDALPKGMAYVIGPATLDTSNLKLISKRSVGPGDAYAETMYLMYVNLNAKSATNKGSGKKRLMVDYSTRTILESVSAQLQLSADMSAEPISQDLSTPLTFSMITSDRDTVSIVATVAFSNDKPVFTLTSTPTPATTITGYAVRCEFLRRIVALDCENNPNTPSTGTCADLNRGWVQIKPINEVFVYNDNPIPDSFTGLVRSGQYEYMVNTYTESKQLLATTSWSGVAERPGASGQTNPSGPSGNDTQPGDPTRPQDNSDGSVNKTSDNAAKGAGDFKLPVYAIILIPTVAFIVILIAAILIYRKYHLVKVAAESSSQEVPVKISDADNIPQ